MAFCVGRFLYGIMLLERRNVNTRATYGDGKETSGRFGQNRTSPMYAPINKNAREGVNEYY